MKILKIIVLLVFPALAFAEIPGWYKRDIAGHIKSANAVVIYRVKNISLEEAIGPYRLYRIDGDKIEELKGSSPRGDCYIVQTEGDWSYPYQIGETRIVILGTEYDSECGVIEPGFGAPASEEYVELFKSIVRD